MKNMGKSPLLNALLAELYIVVLVLILQYGIASSGSPDSILIPMFMLSLFVLSAAVMGYLFLSEPIQLYLKGEKKVAIRFFLQTMGIFGFITITLLATLIATLN